MHRLCNGKTDTGLTFLILLPRKIVAFFTIFDIILLGDVYAFFRQAGCNRYSAAKGRVFPKRKSFQNGKPSVFWNRLLHERSNYLYDERENIY